MLIFAVFLIILVTEKGFRAPLFSAGALKSFPVIKIGTQSVFGGIHNVFEEYSQYVWKVLAAPIRGTPQSVFKGLPACYRVIRNKVKKRVSRERHNGFQLCLRQVFGVVCGSHPSS